MVNLVAEVEVTNETPEGSGDSADRTTGHPMPALDDEGIELARRQFAYWHSCSGDVPKKPSEVQAVLPDGSFLDASVPPQKLQVAVEYIGMRRLDGTHLALSSNDNAGPPKLCKEKGKRSAPSLNRTDGVNWHSAPGPPSACNLVQERLDLDLVDIA